MAWYHSVLTKAVTTIARGLRLTDPLLYQTLGAQPSWSGETVSVDSSLALDTVWACVRLRSSTIATLPLQLYRRDKDGYGIIDRNHPLYSILHDQPNADMTSSEFWELLVACLMLWGNAYAEISRAGGRVVALLPMKPDKVTVRRLQGGALEYSYAVEGQTQILGENDVFHLKGFSLDGVVGISPIAQARNGIGTAIAAEKSAGSFFRNGMRPSLVLKTPNYLNDTQRKRKQEFIDEYVGAINAGRVPLLEGGWEMDTLSLPPDDAQLLGTRAFHVEQLCRWFDVPPVMIGHTQSATAWGTGMEQMMLWFLTFGLRPTLKKIEQTITKSLLTPAQRRDYYAEWNVEGLLRADSQGRAALYAVLADHGLRTRNELRALDNYPPMEGGDDLTVQVNLSPIEKLGETPPAAALAPPMTTKPANTNTTNTSDPAAGAQ